MKNNNINAVKNQDVIVFGSIPDKLKKLDQWVLWKYETRDEKRTKVPYDARKQKRASSTDNDTWCSFLTAYDTFAENPQDYEGIGFMFSTDDPYVGVDFDDCLEDGNLKSWAHELVNLILPTYTEISPSGNGIKMWIQADKTRSENRKSVGDGGIEIYDQGRYFTVTGKLFGQATTVAQNQTGLDQLMQKVWGNPKPKTTPQRKPQARNLDDSKLLDIAMKDVKFSALWFGNWESNTDSYNANYSSQSEADLALCNKLAFYWGRDFNTIDRMFQKSKLYHSKWDRPDYKNRTIEKAIEGVTETYQGSVSSDPDSGFTVSQNLPKTDEHFAEVFINLHGKDVLWCQLWGKWLIWDGRRWKVDDKLRVNNLAREVNKHFLEQASKEDDPKTQNLLIDYARSAAAATRINAFLSLVKAQLGVVPDELDVDPMLLNTPAGTIDLTTGEIKAHNREDRITKMTKATFEDINAACPQWNTFLNEVLDDNAELVDFMQRAVGYALTGEIRENVIFILQGDGANGKSTLVEAVVHTLGDYAKSAAPDLLLQKRNESHPTGVADLMGARFVSSVEVDDGRKLNEAQVKRLTGRDTVKARFMKQDFFDFIPSHKLFMAVNHKPEVHGTDTGIWRRIRLIPFEVEIPEERQDQKLLDKLTEEASGILAWAVRGCVRWQQSGLGLPAAIKDASQAYQQESDVLGRFFEDCCIQKELCEVQTSKLYEAYDAWCQNSGERAHAANKFGQLVKKRNQFGKIKKRINGKSVWVWQGIGLLYDGSVPNSGTPIEHSPSEGLSPLSKSSDPDRHVNYKKMPSRNSEPVDMGQSGTLDDKPAEESNDDVGSETVPESNMQQNEPGTPETEGVDETVPQSLRGDNVLKI